MNFMPNIYWDFGNSMNDITDYGKNPFVINIHGATKRNSTFRTVLWTRNHLQLTVMSFHPGEDIVHPNVDQFLRIKQG
ncbi:mannose-6-phosphate isomerase-like protein (cupin superfamily) [Solibacillus kalamii]|nr:mannose-6-phosphate isomerase-like protein (cupin superfamily) [Solibacillus kalamii]